MILPASCKETQMSGTNVWMGRGDKLEDWDWHTNLYSATSGKSCGLCLSCDLCSLQWRWAALFNPTYMKFPEQWKSQSEGHWQRRPGGGHGRQGSPGAVSVSEGDRFQRWTVMGTRQGRCTQCHWTVQLNAMKTVCFVLGELSTILNIENEVRVYIWNICMEYICTHSGLSVSYKRMK